MSRPTYEAFDLSKKRREQALPVSRHEGLLRKLSPSHVAKLHPRQEQKEKQEAQEGTRQTQKEEEDDDENDPDIPAKQVPSLSSFSLSLFLHKNSLKSPGEFSDLFDRKRSTEAEGRRQGEYFLTGDETRTLNAVCR